MKSPNHHAGWIVVFCFLQMVRDWLKINGDRPTQIDGKTPVQKKWCDTLIGYQI